MKLYRLAVLILISVFILIVSGCGVGFNLSPYFYVVTDSYDFGETILTAPKTVDMKIENHGAASMFITYLTVVDDNGVESEAFKIDTLFDNDGDIMKSPYSNIRMNAKTKLTARIKFQPNTTESYTANFKIIHNASNKRTPYIIELKGKGESMISPNPLDFGKIVSNVKQVKEVRIDNFHTSKITISKIEISSGSAYFRIVSAKRNGLISISSGYFASFLEPGEFIIVAIEASSPGIITRTGSIAVHHDIAEIHSPVYGNLKFTTQDNYSPVIESATLSKPAVKAYGSEYVILNVKVSDQNGLTDISTVVADLTPIGETFMQLYDNGQNGDALDNDGIYTLRFSVDKMNTLIGRIKINISALDYNNAHDDAVAELYYYTGNMLEVDRSGGHAYSNLRDAFSIARSGDYILVYNGIYTGSSNKNLKFNGREILVRSVNGANYAQISCSNSGRGFIFDNPNGENGILQGFKITDTNSSYGGGIYIGDGASPQIIECIITGCRASYGAAILCDDFSEPVIERCEIYLNNSTSAGSIFMNNGSKAEINDCIINSNTAPYAAGVYCYGASSTVENTQFVDNTSTNNGSAIVVNDNSNIVVRDCLFAGNTSQTNGGGIYSSNSIIVIDRCSFENNNSNMYGASIYLLESEGRIQNCKLINNHSGHSGGAVYVSNCTLSFENCLVTNNAATTYGGGFFIIGASNVDLHNNTISKNETISGGGIYFSCSGKYLNVNNTVIWGNVATTGKDIFNSAGYIKLNNVDYFSSTSNVYGQVTPNSSCINSSPQFEDTTTNSLTGILSFSNQSNTVSGSGTKFLTEVKAGDLVYLDIDGVAKAVSVARVDSNSKLTLSGKYAGTGGNDTAVVVHVDYHLKNTSPCIDKGQNSFLPLDLSTDLDNNSRIASSNVDIGAYEYQ